MSIRIESIELDRHGHAVFDETGRIIGWQGVVLKMTRPKGGVIYHVMSPEEARQLGKDLLYEVDFIERFKPVSPEQHEIDRERRRKESEESYIKTIVNLASQGHQYSPEETSKLKNHLKKYVAEFSPEDMAILKERGWME